MISTKIIIRFIGMMFLGILPMLGFTQKLDISLHPEVLAISKFHADQNIITATPFFSVEINAEKHVSSSIRYDRERDILRGSYKGIRYMLRMHSDTIIFVEITNLQDTLVTVKNLVPFGSSQDQIYITGWGDHSLSRSHLFVPKASPVNVILPDNAWELGFGVTPLDSASGISALARRMKHTDADSRRFETILSPNGSVEYGIWFVPFGGPWQEGLRKIFQEKMLFDIGSSDRSLYERKDLQWIKSSYMSHLIMAWDRHFYDKQNGTYTLIDFIEKGKSLYGGDDFIGIWPTWPTLGLDQKNQWDLYRSLPGGLKQLKSLSHQAKTLGTKLFISYNPWDNSSRPEDHLKGMTSLIQETDVDGVILDTRGSSSKSLQLAADNAKNGVVMYSEGMAIPKHMDDIISGRVHNALYYPPVLNLNRLVNPEFSIFRVAELYKEKITREFNLCLFNGHGIELNIFRPGRPPWVESGYAYLGKILRILRLCSSNFKGNDWVPLYHIQDSSLLVNYWPGNHIPEVYTVINFNPKGVHLKLVPSAPSEEFHYFDLWNYRKVSVHNKNINVSLAPFDPLDIGTNNESSITAIAAFRSYLNIHNVSQNEIHVHSDSGDKIMIWPGNPSYGDVPVTLTKTDTLLNVYKLFAGYLGKLSIESYDRDQLIDVQVWEPKRFDLPELISTVKRTQEHNHTPAGMTYIPAGRQRLMATQGDQFIPYPKEDTSSFIHLQSFYIDVHPVTNQQFMEFLEATQYVPKDTTRFLAHWVNGRIPEGLEFYPVVNISGIDAQTYCSWAGKRLPTQWEWQYAAQTEDERIWPWQQGKRIEKESSRITNTLSVEKIQDLDSTLCNIGNGVLDPIGQYPKGANPYGLMDLVGSVWQMTNDVYNNRSYSFRILKGGSYYKPESSWWYVQGGPRPLTYRQMLLEVSDGFERNATVGFRCVVDVNAEK